jgi:hypothetical protein
MIESFTQGMTSRRRCCDCGGLLTSDDGERCAACRPQLSVRAEIIGKERQRQQDELRELELATMEIETLVRRLDRKVRLHGYQKSPKGHGGHPGKALGHLDEGGRQDDPAVGGEGAHLPGQGGAGHT